MNGAVGDRRNPVYVRNVSQKGRGVFANIPFKVGDLIERDPTWGFTSHDEQLLKRSGLFEYYFVRPTHESIENQHSGYVVFGLISMINHSQNPNSKIVWLDEDTGVWASIVALREIQVDEEITHRYANINDYPNTITFVE
ncbi:SET domain-containing protein [Mesorhizobium sp. M1A.F.Ca.IN.020.06.1.1]|uniref:SET domain-containing protein-lysine N-methyltransferase n=1 Tax=unclassified Mesorhizobium TaxID=325217 RepID=UPI000FCA507C|nr:MULTISPECIES: SET domain-containing protein-lysine N-methyltransferase [unclassified Mesorhizobium]RUV81896.1 SET domain-containing protein [Mesorhizobium sp. M1A.F.Ca.IN.020.32.1.1]RUW01524.1 SET domain-containing protein [Mesorhizobium sp. M1A.F.Ca.IN.022.05.2.1]RUW36387.1 SET domain-containing protein [Mesorhizobium sp. M1A.F.Ca.IN.020.06.1.1]RWF82298.1 MAG: SET domain-containing protein [Mesorhizobium sp.]RWG04297.1 MAG: SET domain-containing protein [Mesorhizobium sp.]